MNRRRPEPLALPEEKKASYILTNKGKFVEGDLTISREGLLINSPASTLGGARPGSANSTQPNKRPYQDDDSASSKGSGGSNGEASTSGSATNGGGVAAASPARNGGAGGTPHGYAVYDPPLSIDEFEEVCVIGQGSSGVAKKVRNRRDGRMMVLKVIQFDVSSDTIRKQVTTELRTLYGADHPNVVRYHAAFFDNGAITIAMEYCDAGSLADLLKARRLRLQQQAGGGANRQVPGLPEPIIAHIARQLVAGLQYLHKELKVVHRDIKPSNLLLNSRGEVKISDFGVSGQLASSVSNCLSWVGTVTYMSPERIKGDAYSFDSDLWSLGLTLLECALGRFPYPPPGENPAALGFWELLEYIVMEAPPALPADSFSAELVDFVGQCLQKDAKARPSIAQLEAHPFLALHTQQSADLRDLLEPALGPQVASGARQ